MQHRCSVASPQLPPVPPQLHPYRANLESAYGGNILAQVSTASASACDQTSCALDNGQDLGILVARRNKCRLLPTRFILLLSKAGFLQVFSHRLRCAIKPLRHIGNQRTWLLVARRDKCQALVGPTGHAALLKQSALCGQSDFVKIMEKSKDL